MVYMIGNPGYPRFKIGMTSRLNQRLAEIQAACPLTLSVLRAAHNTFLELEPLLHRHFDDRRTHGEWFDFSSAQEAMVLFDQAVGGDVGGRSSPNSAGLVAI